MERRFLSTALTVEKRADGKPMICGYGSVFYDAADPGTQYELYDDMFERIMPGCFDAALKEDHDCRALFNHDPSLVLGRTASGTCRLSVDKKGLRYEIDPPDTQLARDLMTSIGRGDVSGSSFSFNITDVTWRRVDDGDSDIFIREINSVELFDVSPVTYPAYKSTTSGMRAEVDQAGKEAIAKELAQWRAKNGGLALRRRRQLLAESDS